MSWSGPVLVTIQIQIKLCWKNTSLHYKLACWRYVTWLIEAIFCNKQRITLTTLNHSDQSQRTLSREFAWRSSDACVTLECSLCEAQKKSCESESRRLLSTTFPGSSPTRPPWRERGGAEWARTLRTRLVVFFCWFHLSSPVSELPLSRSFNIIPFSVDKKAVPGGSSPLYKRRGMLVEYFERIP